VLIGWIVGLVALTALSQSAGSDYKNSFSLNGTQSFEALQLLERAAPKASGDIEQVVFAVKQGKVTDRAAEARANAVMKRLKALPEVASVASPYAAGASAQISKSGQVAFANVTMTKQAEKYSTGQATTFVNTATAGSSAGLQVAVEGQVAEQADQPKTTDTGIGALAAAAARGYGHRPGDRRGGHQPDVTRPQHGRLQLRALAADRPRCGR
jgi:RND superfamily putative drug exporter